MPGSSRSQEDSRILIRSRLWLSGNVERPSQGYRNLGRQPIDAVELFLHERAVATELDLTAVWHNAQEYGLGNDTAYHGDVSRNSMIRRLIYSMSVLEE